MSLPYKKRLELLMHDSAELERRKALRDMDMDAKKVAEIFGEQEIPHTSLPEVLLCAALVAVFLAAFGFIG